MIVAGLTHTMARDKVVDFSIGLLPDTITLIAPTTSTKLATQVSFRFYLYHNKRK